MVQDQNIKTTDLLKSQEKQAMRHTNPMSVGLLVVGADSADTAELGEQTKHGGGLCLVYTCYVRVTQFCRYLAAASTTNTAFQSQ